MPYDLRDLPRTLESDAFITGASASATLRSKPTSNAVPTIPTAAGTTEITTIAPFAGTLAAARFTAKDALSAHDTNFVTFGITNKGQAGAGTTAMLAATAANTTKITGGTALAAYTARNLTLNATAANLVVAAGDTLSITFTGAGTLANTITAGHIQLLFNTTT